MESAVTGARQTADDPGLRQGNGVITFENVAYSYGGGELLSDVSLRLAPGSFHFLTGPSGAGKSTFLKLAYAELQGGTHDIVDEQPQAWVETINRFLSDRREL